MAGARIKDISGVQESFNKDLVLLVDKIDTGSGDWLQALKIPLGTLGNTYFQGSSNGLTWHDELLASDEYFRFSTDSGDTWTLLDTDKIREGNLNLYYTDARVSANTDVASNTSSRHTHINKSTLDNIINSGTGTKFLTDDGTYKDISLSESFDDIQFTLGLPNPTYNEGLLFYDDTKKTISYYNEEADVTVNWNEITFRIYNSSGATITNGSVVYPNGATVGLANAHEKEKCRFVAVATHDIENNSYGYVTRLGEVGSLNTSMYSQGDYLYLSDTVDGGLTTSRPTDGSYAILIGVVDVIDAVEGIITVDPYITDLTVEVTDTNGFPSDQRIGTTISFEDSTRTFTISPVSTGFHYYILGDKYEKTSSESITITDVTGLHAIYYDDNTLVSTANPSQGDVDSVIRTKAIVAYVYWNSTTGASYRLLDERHGISMSPSTHAYLHFTRGAQYLSGISPGDFTTGGGSVDADAQFSISSGLIADEDLVTFNNTISSTTGLPIFYKSGINGDWVKVTQAGFSVYNTGSVSGRLYFNEWTGTTWQLTEISSNNDFVLCHVFATNDINDPIISVMGENQYANVTQARLGANNEISELTSTGLPTEEFIPIATVIFKTNSGYANSINAYTELTDEGADYVDWRSTELAQGTPASSHSNLTNLNLADTGIAWGHIDDQAQTLYGIKTFNEFGITPSSAPTADYQWANKKYVDDVAGSGGSPLTTKGDLFTYDTSATRLPVGTDGYMLTANSATSTGLEWVVAPTAGTGTVTSIDAGDGLDFTSITTTGSITLGIPSALSSLSTNAISATSHTHSIVTGIANTNIVRIDDASTTTGDYAKFTSDGLLGRSVTELKTDISLDNVENTALSTWTGTTNVTTVGTIGTGTWQGTVIADTYIAQDSRYKAQAITIACSDETSDLSAGSGVVTFRMPFAMTITSVKATVTTAPAGSTLIVDINESGTSIISVLN